MYLVPVINRNGVFSPKDTFFVSLFLISLLLGTAELHKANLAFIRVRSGNPKRRSHPNTRDVTLSKECRRWFNAKHPPAAT